MAVELRCPDCRARLQLATDPAPGDEVECPECNAIFPAPDPDTGEAPDRRKKKPAGEKKRPRDDDGGGGDRPKKKAGDKKAEPAAPQQPKKRKVKKKKANKPLIVGLVIGGVVFASLLGYVLYRTFIRVPVEHEMIRYLPADSVSAAGLNVGLFRKYPEYFKKVEAVWANARFKKAADALARAVGGDVNDLYEYGVQGWGPSGGAVVLRTVKEFDEAGLKKLPGAKEYAAGGQRYYTIDPVDGLGLNGPRVFAPTNRLVVFCPGDLPEATFKGMLGGNRDNADKTLLGRAKSLVSRAAKGTFWWVELYEDSNPRPVAPAADPNSSGNWKALAATTVSAAKGFGFRAGVGARSVRFEAIVYCRDSDAAGQLYEKYKNSPLSKGDEAEVPMREWRDFSGTFGDKKIQTEMISNIKGEKSGDLFILGSACDTVLMMNLGSGIASRIAGAGGTGGGGGAAAPPPPPGAPPAPPPGK